MYAFKSDIKNTSQNVIVDAIAEIVQCMIMPNNPFIFTRSRTAEL